MTDKVKEFWDSRADLGEIACTTDLIAKQLEINAISNYARDGMNILDLGCGNGITAFEIARRYHCKVTGIDYSQPLIDEAIKMVCKAPKRKGECVFMRGDMSDPNDTLWEQKPFDMVYTERAIINLPSWEKQRQAIVRIFDLLKPGGIYVMCENSMDALNRLNEVRQSINLDSIKMPWHNKYLDEICVKQHLRSCGDVYLKEIVNYSSTYYFLSRVINAWDARAHGSEPQYDAPINRLALSMPSIGDVGQGKIWVFKKMTTEEKEYVNLV